jgi:diacylglycerol kinase family enzyme
VKARTPVAARISGHCRGRRSTTARTRSGGGGDGSLAVVARLVAERRVPFVCVPAETRNHFARDLGVDREDPARRFGCVHRRQRARDRRGRGQRPHVLTNVSLGIYGLVVHETRMAPP